MSKPNRDKLSQLSLIVSVSVLKPKQVRIYLQGDALSTFTSLIEASPLSETQLLGLLVDSALRAVELNGGRLTIPLEFSISESDEKNRYRTPRPSVPGKGNS